MFTSSRPLDILRSLVYLTLLGFAVIVLSGPVIAVAGALLPFALVGALVWGGYRFACVIVRRIRGEKSRLVLPERVPEVAPVAPVLFQPTVEERPVRRAPRRWGPLMRTGMYVVVEMGCGAALGAALCVLANWQAGPGLGHPALGGIIGAVVGFVVGGSRPRSTWEQAEEVGDASSQAA